VLIHEAIESGFTSFMEHYFTYLLERKLNSPEFLRDVNKNAVDKL
jgi:hypothetical protein